MAALWQRLNFLPLPHQHGSLALSTPWLHVEDHRHDPEGYRRSGATPQGVRRDGVIPLEPLPPVQVEAVELVTVPAAR